MEGKKKKKRKPLRRQPSHWSLIPWICKTCRELARTVAPKGSHSEPPWLCTAVAVEKEETCLQTGMQSCDRQKIFFFHPLKTQDRRVTNVCQEEEPHRHEPMRKEEGQQQQEESRVPWRWHFCPDSGAWSLLNPTAGKPFLHPSVWY